MIKYISILLLLALSCSTSRENFTETQWSAEVNGAKTSDLYAPHFRDGEYFNPWMSMKSKSFLELLAWKLSSKETYSEDEKNHLPRVIPNALERIRAIPGRDFILWVGHNSFLIRIKGEYWITDPIFSESLIFLKRKTAPGISLRDLKSLTDTVNVVISHNHYDHLDEESVKGMPEKSRFYVPLGLRGFMEGIGKKNIIEMDWWQELPLGEGNKIVCLPAQHWSRRITQSYNTSLWANYLLVTSRVSIFISGDSGYFIGYREFGKKYPGIDYALFPVAAAYPRWFMHYAHMNDDEAVTAFRDLGAKFFIPGHWGTFHLGDEPSGFAGVDLEKKIRQKGMDRNKFIIMDIGEIVLIDDVKR